MIIINCNETNFSVYKSKLRIRSDYITSIEYIDNEYDEVLIKATLKDCIYYFNLNVRLHNPIGAARIYYNPKNLEYFLNGVKFSKEKFDNTIKFYKK